MKKTIGILVMLFILLFDTKVSASTLEVQAIVNGKIEVGENINILINVNEISSLYAGDVTFKYDPTLLKVNSIEPGDLITNMPKVEKFDVLKNVDEQKGLARYAFSCLGKIKGYSGSGSFINIRAVVLRKDNFQINSIPFLKELDNDFNLKLQLYDSNIEEFDYIFKSFRFSADSKTANNNSSNSTKDNPSVKNSNNIPSTSPPSQNKSNTITDNKPNINVNDASAPKDTTNSQNKAENSKAIDIYKKSGNKVIFYGVLGSLIFLGVVGGYVIVRKK